MRIKEKHRLKRHQICSQKEKMVGTWKKFVSETWLILPRTLKKVAHPCTRLLKVMKTLETGFMIIMWDQILQRFLKASVLLQSADQDLNSVCALHESLYGYIKSL